MSELAKRQYFKSYIAMINNSAGTQMYRNFYVRTVDGNIIDVIGDGENACALYVSSLLVVFGKQKSAHATVASTIIDLEESGWQIVDRDDIKIGDVIVWAGRDNTIEGQHIGFYIGNGEAMSTSSSQKKVVKHDVNFGQLRRAITATYRMRNW